MKSALLLVVTAISSSLTNVLGIPTTQNETNFYPKRSSQWICGAVSPSTSKYAIGVGSSEAQALNSAKLGCAVSGCTLTKCVMNGCVAIAQGPTYHTVAISSGWNSVENDREHADSQAMADCMANDPNCKLSDNGCTGNAT
jgi:hypothetical protein